MPGGEMKAVVVTQDHHPNLEQERGATRLAQEQLYWEEGVAYLTTPLQPHHTTPLQSQDGQQVQRLRVSRSLADFDLTGKNATVARRNLADPCLLILWLLTVQTISAEAE